MSITSMVARTTRQTFMAGAMLFTSAVAALAVEAAATTELNVRTGPGTSFSVLDVLDGGEVVSILECQASGWCYVQHTGPDGWVSSRYLEAIPEPGGSGGSGSGSGGSGGSGGSSSSDCELRLTLGSGRPRMELVCPTAPPPPPPPPPPVEDKVCFYRGTDFSGTSFCYGPGQLNSLNATFNDRISSLKTFGDAKVRVCIDNNLRGFCKDIAADVPALGARLQNRISSLVVYTGTPPATPSGTPPGPRTFRTGSLEIPSSYSADLDTGSTGGSGTDLWHHAINAAVRRLEPLGGAMIAVGDGSNRGYDGCKDAAFSLDPVPFALLTVGTYVCVKTNRGRISQFRVNGYDGTTLKIGFTTWARE